MPTNYFEYLSTVTSNLLDGGLSLASVGDRPSILIVGPAKEGISETPQLIVEASDVRRLYGKNTEMERRAAEIIAQAGDQAYYIYCMRIGGIAPKIKLTSTEGGIIYLTPTTYHDNQATERLQLIFREYEAVPGSGDYEQRILIRDIVDEALIWDSHGIEDINYRAFYMEKDFTSGEFKDSQGDVYQHAHTENDGYIISEMVPIMDLSTVNQHTYTLSDTDTLTTSQGNQDTITIEFDRVGNDGTEVPLMQQYVFMDRSLDGLAFKEFDYILPCGTYFLDAPNIADSYYTTSSGENKIVHHEHPQAVAVNKVGDSSSGLVDFSLALSDIKSTPTNQVAGEAVAIDTTSTNEAASNVLGWLWQTEYEQKKYYCFASRKGWEKFVALSETITLTVASQNLDLVIEDSTNRLHTFTLTLGGALASGGVTSLAVSLDNTTPISNSSWSGGVTPTLTLGTQGATIGDIQNYLEQPTGLASIVEDSTGVLLPNEITVSSAVDAAGLLDTALQIPAATDFNPGPATLAETGSITFDIDFDTTYDPYSITIDVQNGNSNCVIEETSGTQGGELAISFDDDQPLSALETALNGLITNGSGGFTISNVVVSANGANALLDASGSSLSVSSVNGTITAANPLTADQTDTLLYTNNYYTHEDLTGEVWPDAVEALFESASANEFRECSFAHQIATFCHKSSSTWKTIMTCMSFQEPEIVGSSVRIGQSPIYTSISGNLAIDNATEGGTGLLGYKFTAGAPGYRDQVLGSIASSSDGFAYGGLIMTEGGLLPDRVLEPYGIEDSDEAKDSRGFAIDIGKYIVPCAMWIIHSNSYNNSAGNYKGPITGVVTGKIGITPIGNEPIGVVNGSLNSVSGVSLANSGYPYAAINKLAGQGFATVVFRPGRGTYINNLRTMAHRNSDYRKVSTVRAVNRVVQGVRNLAEDYIGLAYNSANVASLQTSINGYLRAEQSAGIHNGAIAQIAFNRTDRLLGNIKIRITMVPPFAIESITVTTSLIADESNLSS